MKTCQTIIIAAFLAATAQAQPADPAKLDIAKDLDATLRRLEKEISAVRGLAFKEPVKAKVIRRGPGVPKEKQGYYSPAVKTLFLYDDIKGSYQLGVLIHEMVHALQDQHFNLSKLQEELHKEKYGSDADLALAALIEGDATFTMIEVMKKENPKVTAMLEMPLAEAKNPQNAFLYGQGARYVKALKDKGGWTTVNFAYKFPPRHTASMFNLGGVQAIDLGPGKGQGAFELFKKLAELPATRVLAEQAAKSWRGERAWNFEASSATMFALSTKENAVLVQEALSKWKEEKLKLKMRSKDAAGTIWTAENNWVHGVLLRGQRVISIAALSDADFARLRDNLEGPLQLTVYAARDKRNISFAEMTERLLGADLICIGETHDAELHHRASAPGDQGPVRLRRTARRRHGDVPAAVPEGH